MVKEDFKKVILASMVLFGGIVGAGVLAIPYAVSRVGAVVGIFYILAVGCFTLLINLMIGEIASRTKGFVHFAGYGKKYLNAWWQRLLALAVMLNIYGAILAYIIGEGEVLSALFGGSGFVWSLIFTGVGACLIFLGMKFWARFNLALTFFLVCVLTVIIVWGFGSIRLVNLEYVNFTDIFLPYGVILFALSGAVIIPSVEQIVDEKIHLFRVALWIGTLLPMVFYIVFTLMVVGVSGINTTQVATVGLGNRLGMGIFVLGNLFSLFAMATSFLSLGGSLKDMWQWDFSLNRFVATLATLVLPLLVFLLGWRSFVSVLSLMGALAVGMISIISVLIFWQAAKKGEVKIYKPLLYPKFLGIMVIIIAVLGMVAAFWEHFF